MFDGQTSDVQLSSGEESGRQMFDVQRSSGQMSYGRQSGRQLSGWQLHDG